jgi:hypothetical protein
MTHNNENRKLESDAPQQCSQSHTHNNKKDVGAHTTLSSLPFIIFANPKSTNFGCNPYPKGCFVV